MRIPTLRFVWESLRHPSRDGTLAAQAVRQGLSGSVTTLTDLAVFQLCLWGGLAIWLSAAVSFVFALLANFLGMRWYVFGDVARQRRNKASQAALYILVALSSLGIIQAWLWVFAVRAGFPPLLVKAAGVPVVFLWTVLAGRFVFAKKGDADDGQS